MERGYVFQPYEETHNEQFDMLSDNNFTIFGVVPEENMNILFIPGKNVFHEDTPFSGKRFVQCVTTAINFKYTTIHSHITMTS